MKNLITLIALITFTSCGQVEHSQQKEKTKDELKRDSLNAVIDSIKVKRANLEMKHTNEKMDALIEHNKNR